MEIVVADAAKLGLSTLGKKTDRRDAREMARRLRLGDIDRHATTYYPSDDEYGVRKLSDITRTLREPDPYGGALRKPPGPQSPLVRLRGAPDYPPVPPREHDKASGQVRIRVIRA